MALIIAQGIISSVSSYMTRYYMTHFSFDEYLIYSQLFSVIATLIYPILFVAVLYLIGRNLDLKLDIAVISLSLLIGCLVGLIISSLIYYSLAFPIPRHPLSLITIIIYSCLGLAIDVIIKFFVGFGALTIGFLTAKR